MPLVVRHDFVIHSSNGAELVEPGPERKRRDRSGIQPAAQGDHGTIGAQSFLHRGVQQLAKVLLVVSRLLITDFLVRRERPVPLHQQLAATPGQGVRGRKTMDAGKNRGRGVLRGTMQQEISDGELVQTGCGLRLHANAIQRVAEDQPSPRLRIIKGLNAQLVMCAEERLALPVPDRETEVSQQAIEASLPPGSVGAKDQLGIAGAFGACVPGALQFGEKAGAGIQPRVGHYPQAAIETEWLLLVGGLWRGAEQGMTQTDSLADPGLLRVGPAKAHELSQRLQEGAVDRFPTHAQNTNDSAHFVRAGTI